MATTFRADLYNPQLSAAYASFAFVDNLSMMRKFVRTDKNAPFQMLNTDLLRRAGNFLDNPKFNPMTNLVTRRDNTSSSAATTVGMTTRNDVGVRLSFKIGPVPVAESAMNQGGWTPEAFAKEFGEQAGKQFALFLRKKLIKIAKAIVGAMTATAHTYSVYAAVDPKATLTTKVLSNARTKLGDSEWLSTDSQNSGWIFRSESLYDLAGYQLGQMTPGLADTVSRNGSPITLGIDYATADDPSLYVAGTPPNYDKFYTLAVGPGLIQFEIDKLEFGTPWYKGDLENPAWYFRGDVECLVTCVGFAWDKTNGGINPDDTALANTAYWTPTYSDAREIKALLIEHNSTVS